jgi:iron complex outermembrane receptor protein
LTANGSIFYYDYKNQQFLNIDPITAAQTLNSIPKSKIQGAELELSGRATPDLHLNIGAGFVDARVVKGSFSGISINGFRLVAAPRWTGTVGMDWRALHGGFGELNVHLDGSYTSSQYFGVLNTPAVYWGGYGLLNANVAYVMPNGKTQISLWGKNLTDRLYATFIADLQAGFGEINTEWGPPLTYGIELRHKF